MNKSPKSVSELKQLIKEGNKFEFVFFYGSCLSNWYASSFTIDGIKYYNSEQWMMAEKARTFGDMAMLQAILLESDPKEVKAMGRDVANYNEEVWAACRYEKVLRGVLEKFRQNENIKKYLLNTGDAIIVEASPYDAIWGIKRGEHEHGLTDVNTWKGLNLLGFVLMDARDIIENETSIQKSIITKLGGCMKC